MRVLILILISFSFSLNLEITPRAYIEYVASGGDLTKESGEIAFMGWSINTVYYNNNFNIESSFSAHGINGYTPRYTDLNQRQGIPYLVNYMDNYQDLGIYWTSQVNVKYKKDNIIFEAGNKNRNIGLGINSIFVSNKPPNYPTIGFNWQISSTIHYNYFYAFLNQSNNNVDNYRIYSYKSMAIHQLTYNISDKFMLSMYESVIFDRYMDINYLNPFVLYYPLSRYMGYNDNNQIGLELVFNLNQYQKHYFSLLIDEWDPDLTFDKYHENWIAYQLGSQVMNIFTQNDKFSIEYTWADYRVYENQYDNVNFFLKGYPLGYWAGAHSKTIYLEYNFTYLKINIKSSYLDVKKGISPENLIDIAYNKIEFDRFSLGYEQKKIYSFEIFYKFNEKIKVGANINFLNWIQKLSNDSNIIGRFYFGFKIYYQMKKIVPYNKR